MNRKMSITALSVHFSKIASSLANFNFQPEMELMRDALVISVRTAFTQSIDPVDGTPWRPLKHRRGRTLVLTGHLMATALAAAATAQITNNSITVSGIVDYGVYHQEGTIHIPRRRFIGFSAKDLSQFDKMLTDSIQRLVL